MGKKGGKADAGPMLEYSQKGLDLQKQMYEEGKQYAQPYYEAGKTGLNTLMQKLGLSGDAASSDYGSLMKGYTGQDIYEDPSYKFRFEQGNKAAERALLAQGKYLAPSGVQALQDYGQGLASQEYGAAYNRYNTDQENIYNRLANISGLGQTAGAQNAQLGQNYANAGSDLYTGMGNAITAATLAGRANRTSMFNTLLGAAGTGLSGTNFSDPSLKDNVTPLGVENGHNVYKFTYKFDDSKTEYIGAMADEVKEINPDAVGERDGYMTVDYDKIGVKFREA